MIQLYRILEDGTCARWRTPPGGMAIVLVVPAYPRVDQHQAGEIARRVAEMLAVPVAGADDGSFRVLHDARASDAPISGVPCRWTT